MGWGLAAEPKDLEQPHKNRNKSPTGADGEDRLDASQYEGRIGGLEGVNRATFAARRPGTTSEIV
ncbi:MAG: hypothetical protein GX589_04095 [Deltaproteobacteria bacterium]|nr:hypothetical protein [Deltaproteobacteria bacterium]